MASRNADDEMLAPLSRIGNKILAAFKMAVGSSVTGVPVVTASTMGMGISGLVDG